MSDTPRQEHEREPDGLSDVVGRANKDGAELFRQWYQELSASPPKRAAPLPMSSSWGA